MSYRAQAIRRIVEKSAFLYERMRPCFVPGREDEDDVARQRMERWAQHIGRGKPEQFQFRLRHDQLTPVSAATLASGVRLQHPHPLPAWAHSLDRVLEISQRLRCHTLPQVEQQYFIAGSAKEIGFSHLMVPFALHAIETLDPEVSHLKHVLTSGAYRDLQLDLVRALSNAARETLALEFSVWKTACMVTEQTGREASGRDLYASFIAMMWDGGLERLFTKYPVLARILGQTTDQWIASTRELIERVSRDVEAFRAFGPQGASPGAMVHCRTSLSDRHNGGRTVLGVEFENGLKLIYKTKDPRTQIVLDGLLEWLNQNGAPLELRTLKMVERDSYHWIEEIVPVPCDNVEQVARYYRRSGMLLCVMYFLGGYDFHAENLIACGEHPVIIDPETILHLELRPADTLAAQGNLDSVVRTCMLPRRSVMPAPKDYNCGLAHKGSHGHILTRVHWEKTNTDEMRLTRTTTQTPLCHNVLYLNGTPVPADEHIECIVRGFREMYGLLLRLRDRLCAHDGPLAPMTQLHPRFVFRNTGTYERVLRDMLQPQHLRDGMEASIRVDVLSRALLEAPSNLRFWPLLAEEHAALCAGDVPMFFHSAQTGELITLGGRRINAMSADSHTGFELVCCRFQSMNEAECECQVMEIRRSFQD